MLRREKRKNVYSPLTESFMQPSEQTNGSPSLNPTLSSSMASTMNTTNSVMSPTMSSVSLKSNGRLMTYNKMYNNPISPRCQFWFLTIIPASGYVISAFLLLALIFGPDCTPRLNSILCIAVGLSLLSTFFRRAAAVAFNEQGRITYHQILPSIDMVELAPRTLRARTCLYTLLADVVILPLCIATALFREINEVMIFGSWMMPPALPSRIPFMCLFALLPLCSIAACYIFYIRFLLYDRLDVYQITSRRASTVPSMLALLTSMLVIPALMASMCAFPCEDGYMRFATTVKCQSFTHRLCMFVALPFILLLVAYMELAIGSFRVIADDATDLSSVVSEVRNDVFTLELFYMVRLLTVCNAVLEPHIMRCNLLVLVSASALFRLTQSIGSTVFAIQHIMKGIMCVIFVSSVMSVLVHLFNLEDSYIGLALWMIAWLISINTAIIMYIERHGCTLFERREDSRVCFSSI